MRCDLVHCSVLQCVALCCIVLQSVAARCSILQPSGKIHTENSQITSVMNQMSRPYKTLSCHVLR